MGRRHIPQMQSISFGVVAVEKRKIHIDLTIFFLSHQQKKNPFRFMLLKIIGIVFIVIGIGLLMAYYSPRVQIMPWKKIILSTTAYIFSWILLTIILFFIFRGE
jgi:hypothetical protein